MAPSDCEKQTMAHADAGILVEGRTEAEILALPTEQLEVLVLSGEPLVLRAGSAQVLGTFRKSGTQFVVELAQVEGGGEGVLLALVGLARKVGLRFNCESIGWTVYAVDCAKPNLKLRRVLLRRGFEVSGSAYRLTEQLAAPQDRRYSDSMGTSEPNQG